MIGPVAAGVGVAVVESSLSGVRADEVAYRQLVDPPLIAEIAVAWKQDSSSALVQALLQIAREVVSDGIFDNEDHRSVQPG